MTKKKPRKRGIAPTPSPARDLEYWQRHFYLAVGIVVAITVGGAAWVYFSG